MGDARFEHIYHRVRDAEEPLLTLHELSDEDVIAALAAASHEGDPYLANVLATEAMNRTRRGTAVARTLGEGVIALDAAGRVRFVNPATEVMLDMGRGELLGREFHDAVHGGDGGGSDPGDRPILHVLATGTPARGVEDVFVRRDGAAFPVELTATPLHLHEATAHAARGAPRAGEVDGAVVVFRDVTVARRAEEALAESEQRYRSLYEHSPDAIFSLDAEGRFLSANPACEGISGRPPEELLGEPFAPLIDPDCLEAAFENFQRVLGGEARTDDYTLIHRDGRAVEIRVTGVPMVVRGAVVGMHGVARDVTDAKRAAAALRRRMDTERALSAVSARFVDPRDLDAAIDGALATLGAVAGADRAYLFRLHDGLVSNTHEWCAPGVPPAIGALQGIPEGAVPWWMARIRRGESIHIPSVARLPPEAAAERRILEDQGVTSLIVLPVQAGERLHGFAGFDNVRAPDAWSPEDARLLRVASQIIGGALARHESEERLRRLNEDLELRVAERTRALEAANRELEAFTYTVSHDLKEPLRGVEALTEFLLEDLADDVDGESRDNLQRVRRAVGHMKATLEGALHLSRAGSGELRREPVDLSATARDVLDDLAARHPHRRVAHAVAPGVAAHADPRLARTVLENLLGNAWKYTAREPAAHVAFGAAGDDGHTAYFVRDNGAGFDPAHGHRLFEPFQRLHGDDEFEGSGVGLATVKRIVERHGGRCWAESAGPGEGATFWFTLAPPPEEAPQGPP